MALQIECRSSRRGKRHSPLLGSEASPQGLAEFHVVCMVKFLKESPSQIEIESTITSPFKILTALSTEYQEFLEKIIL